MKQNFRRNIILTICAIISEENRKKSHDMMCENIQFSDLSQTHTHIYTNSICLPCDYIFSLL